MWARGHRALLVLIGLAACAAPESDADWAQEDWETSQHAILGGSEDLDNDATVALLITTGSGHEALCSGTVIKRAGDTGYVLTAAHCVSGSVDLVMIAEDWMHCFSPPPSNSSCRATHPVASWVAHPGYGSHSGYDFGIVVFRDATASTPVAKVLATADELETGSIVDISGYGRTYSGPNQQIPLNSVRRHVSVPIQQLTSTQLRFDTSKGKGSCFGDSGGPAYAWISGKRRVVGVTSAGDAECEQYSVSGRVSAVYDDFIAPHTEEHPLSACGACLRDASSPSAACKEVMAECRSASACRDQLDCLVLCSGDAACRASCGATASALFAPAASCALCACNNACGQPSCDPTPNSATDGPDEEPVAQAPNPEASAGNPSKVHGPDVQRRVSTCAVTAATIDTHGAATWLLLTTIAWARRRRSHGPTRSLG